MLARGIIAARRTVDRVVIIDKSMVHEISGASDTDIFSRYGAATRSHQLSHDYRYYFAQRRARSSNASNFSWLWTAENSETRSSAIMSGVRVSAYPILLAND